MPYQVQWINQWSQLGQTMVDALVTDMDGVLPDQRFNCVFRNTTVDAAFLAAQEPDLIAAAMANVDQSQNQDQGA